jgi:hypothetical protein
MGKRLLQINGWYIKQMNGKFSPGSGLSKEDRKWKYIFFKQKMYDSGHTDVLF